MSSKYHHTQYKEEDGNCNELLHLSSMGDLNNDGIDDAIIIWIANILSIHTSSPGIYGYTVYLSDKNTEVSFKSFSNFFDGGENALPMQITDVKNGVVHAIVHTVNEEESDRYALAYYESYHKYIFSEKEGKLVELRN